MKKIGYFKIIGLIGLLAEELTIAAEDGKITVSEAIRIVVKICETLNLDFDIQEFKIGQ